MMLVFSLQLLLPILISVFSEHMKKFGPDTIWWYKMRHGTRTVGLRDEDEGLDEQGEV